MTGEGDFTAYAEARLMRLRQRAYLLCHDWHLAQDLTQITLARLYASWRSISKVENVDAYTAKIMVRAFLDHKRRRSSREVVTDSLPEQGDAGSSDLRLTLLDALRGLPPRERAIVVLRYWEDHSVDAVAEMLGITPSVVRTQSMRALAQLRTALGADISALVD